MKFIATFETAEGVEKSFVIGDSMDLQDAFNVVANNHLTTKNITLSENRIEMRNPENTTPNSNKNYKGVIYFTPKEIQEKHNLTKKEIEKLLNEGADHELEHTDDYLMAQYIASSHLYETPNYYKRLKDLKLAKGNLMKIMAKGGQTDDDLEGKLDYILNLKPLYDLGDFESNKEEIKGFNLNSLLNYFYERIATQFYKIGIELNEDYSYLQRGRKLNVSRKILYAGEDDKADSIVLIYASTITEDEVVYRVVNDDSENLHETHNETEAEEIAEILGGYVEIHTFDSQVEKVVSYLLIDLTDEKLLFRDELTGSNDVRKYGKGGSL